MNDDEMFWLEDAAAVLRSNGTVQHATHVQYAIGIITHLRAENKRLRKKEVMNVRSDEG